MAPAYRLPNEGCFDRRRAQASVLASIGADWYKKRLVFRVWPDGRPCSHRIHTHVESLSGHRQEADERQHRVARQQPQAPSQKFKDMSFSGKIVFLGKVVIFLASFGFAFPLIFND